VLMLPSAGAQATTPPGFFGLNYSFKDITSKDVFYLKASGAKTVRWTMLWPAIEPLSGKFNWSVPDRVVGDLAAQGIRVVPVVWGSPRWVASSTISAPVGTAQARNAWQSFLRTVVHRYGPGGAYWTGAYRSQHPGKTSVPINTWEVWNEPNLPSAMKPTTPSVYAQLLALAHTAIRQADPNAQVMFAGLLSHPPNGLTAWNFLSGVYGAGGQNKFEIMASNAYAPSVSAMLDDLGKLRQTMAGHGDGRTPLWISEVGWGSAPVDPKNGGQTKGMTGQKQILVQAFNALEQKRSLWHIGKVLWFNFRDPSGGNSNICAYCTSAGLLFNDFRAKPAWSSFLNYTH
jgi:polysaccharide biosynthesis protein PslG